MTRTYKFSDPVDMAELAREIQSKVYWNSKFYLGDDDTLISYSEFWDIVLCSIEDGDVAVIISENDIVRFI